MSVVPKNILTPLPDDWREKLEALWPNGDRLTLAMRLSPTREVCVDLLRGYHVDPARLDQDWLKWAKREQYVALKPAIDCV